MPEFLTIADFPARHGFFTRRGGVSSGVYASLNCGFRSGDDLALIRENRARVAESMGVPRGALLGLTQVHGTEVVIVTDPWPEGAGPAADAMVTKATGVALGIVTADCAPVLFMDAAAAVIGAAHAGWRGAVAGVLEATIAAMVSLGATADRITAAIGPCIRQSSYEVGDEVRDTVQAQSTADTVFFQPGIRPAHWQFDLAGYCKAHLQRIGVTTLMLEIDTLGDETRFFSHRRRTLAGGGQIGHQISVIAQ